MDTNQAARNVDIVIATLLRGESQPYIGEPVSQLEHALQAAHFAQVVLVMRALRLQHSCTMSGICWVKKQSRWMDLVPGHTNMLGRDSCLLRV